MGEDRRDHERGDGAQQLDDREHTLEVRGGSEKPATNSAGATVAPRPMPVRPEPISVSVSLGRHCTPKDRDSGREEHHPDQREVVDRAAC